MPAVPDVDLSSGLEPVVPRITVPSGQFGRYVCGDRSLGVNQGPSPFLRVLCRNDSTNEIAPVGEWPVCKIRTTTVNPGNPLFGMQRVFRTDLKPKREWVET